MKRTLILAAVLGLFAPVGLIGCSEESKVEEKKTTSTPGGTVTETKTDKVEKTGDAKEGAK